MTKELFVSSTPHETKLAIVEDDQLAEVYFERENEYTLAGSIYKGRVTRVLPGMQSAFVDVGLERDAFLYVTDFIEMTGEEDQDEFEQVMVSRPQAAFQVKPEAPPEPVPVLESEPEEEGEDEGDDEGENGADASQQNPDDLTPEGARRWRGRNRRRRGRRGGRPFAPEAKLNRPREEPPPPAEPRDSRELREPRPHHAPPEREHFGPPAGYEPIILPGESISKYRRTSERPEESAQVPQEMPTELLPKTLVATETAEPAVTAAREAEGAVLAEPSEAAQPKAAAEAPVTEAPKPRPAEHHPLVLPGESISKYRDWRPKPAEPVESQTAAVQAEEQPAPATAASTVEEPHSATEEQRFETMNLAAVFGGDAAEVAPATEVERGAPEAAPTAEPSTPDEPAEFSPADKSPEPVAGEPLEQLAAEPEQQPAIVPPATEAQPQHAFGHAGTLEELEVEDEEEDLPLMGEDLEDVHYEEMEEETLHADGSRERNGNGYDTAVEAGEDVTEALEESAQEEVLDEYDEGEEEGEGGEGEEGEFEEEGEETEAPLLAEGEQAGYAPGENGGDGRAELRGPSGAAGYQQRTDRGAFRRGGGGRGRRGGRGRLRQRRDNVARHNVVISDLLREGQEVLVQIAKEPIGKKGARITSHIALPGRFLVYMPTVHHVGVSRKIASDEERQRLKRIVLSEVNGSHGGFIVRTAAENVKEDELRADIRFLKNLWTEIKNRSDNTKAPALIYYDLNLVERVLRDQISADFSQIWVDSELEYERVLRFLSRFQPNLLRRVKLYTKETPLFEHFGIQDEINKALKSKVWLKSGGYIVINQTEALVAIDINTGKYVGKTQRLEDTIVKTNIDAIREIVRQIRLRDLGGIIVIDFIDMDERKNRQKVMQALEEALKSDRSPSKVLQFNDFGLVAITRKRVKQSLERTLCQPCEYCSGTGMLKSVTTVCNEIYVELKKIARHLDKKDVTLRVHPEVAKALKGNSARLLTEMEELTGRPVLIKSDPTIHQEQFDIN